MVFKAQHAVLGQDPSRSAQLEVRVMDLLPGRTAIEWAETSRNTTALLGIVGSKMWQHICRAQKRTKSLRKRR